STGGHPMPTWRMSWSAPTQRRPTGTTNVCLIDDSIRENQFARSLHGLHLKEGRSVTHGRVRPLSGTKLSPRHRLRSSASGGLFSRSVGTRQASATPASKLNSSATNALRRRQFALETSRVTYRSQSSCTIFVLQSSRRHLRENAPISKLESARLRRRLRRKSNFQVGRSVDISSHSET